MQNRLLAVFSSQQAHYSWYYKKKKRGLHLVLFFVCFVIMHGQPFRRIVLLTSL